MSTTKNEKILLIGLLCAIGTLGALATVAVTERVEPADEVVVSLCATEDSEGPCWWNAETQGNGTGVSFFVAENGDTYYLLDVPSCADAPEFDCLTGEGLGR